MRLKGWKQVNSEQFQALFAKGRPVRIAQMDKALGVDHSTVCRLIRRHGALRSVNHNGGYCVLPEMCEFDSLGLCELRGMLFHRDGGGQLDAIVRLVTESAAGMSLADIRGAMKVDVAMQLLRLGRQGRVRRTGERRAYVYLAADHQRAEEQTARRRAAAPGQERQTVAELLAEQSRESLQLLVNVLLTCLRHPEFSPKSIALSLLRRGCRTCTAQVRELYANFEISKKKGS